MPNKGKKSGSRPTKQSKKGKSNSAVEISRSFAKKDANIFNQTSSVNQNLVGDDASIKPAKTPSTNVLSSNTAATQLHPNLNNELIRIFATTGVIDAILVGLSFII